MQMFMYNKWKMDILTEKNVIEYIPKLPHDNNLLFIQIL